MVEAIRYLPKDIYENIYFYVYTIRLLKYIDKIFNKFF